MPANLAAKNLADGIWEGLASRVATASVVVAAVATAAAAHVIPSADILWEEHLLRYTCHRDGFGKSVPLCRLEGIKPFSADMECSAQWRWRGLVSTCPPAIMLELLACAGGTEGYAAASAAAAVGFATFPFLGPLAEVYLFSQKTAEQIEDTVRIKESLQVAIPLFFTCITLQPLSKYETQIHNNNLNLNY